MVPGTKAMDATAEESSREVRTDDRPAVMSDNRREILAGATTFMTMAYIIIVNPIILSAAGMPFGPTMVATIIVAGVATLACGLYAKKPFAMAPYMGENAFFAYAVVLGLGVTWNAALGAVFIAGLLFLLISVSGWRKTLLDSIPPFLSAAWGVALGLFLLFIGLANAGIAVPGSPGAPVQIGDLARPEIVLVFIGIAVTLFLHLKKVPGSILIGMGAMLALGFLLGGLGIGTDLPSSVPSPFGPIPDWGEVLFQLDIAGALNLTLLPVILVMFMMDFFDTAGTILGLGSKAGMLDEKGRMSGIDRVMQVDAASTVVGGLFGTSTAGTFVESASGLEQGGRTGKTAVVAGLLFLSMLALTPFFGGIPTGFLGIVAAPALVVVGISMMTPIKKIDFDDMPQAITVVLTIAFMLFTFNIGFGLAIGLIAYPLAMVASGRKSELNRTIWLLFALGLMLFAAYPY